MNSSLAITKISTSQIEFSISKKRSCDAVLENITEPMLKLPKRIMFSFAPPLSLSKQYLFTDFVGPSLSTLVLVSLLQYSFSQKKIPVHNISSINVVCIVLSYYFILSFCIYIASRIVNVKLKLLDILTLIGYSFYGFIVTLSIPLALRMIESDSLFYFCLILFSGLSCVRVLLILLFAIEMPIARFLICSLIGNVHILFVIYLYYVFVNPTYDLIRPHLP